MDRSKLDFLQILEVQLRFLQVDFLETFLGFREKIGEALAVEITVFLLAV